jgi:hypothetical protein
MSLRSRIVHIRKHWFAVLWTFIGVVSLFDGFLVARFSDVILEVEENPIGSYLLGLDEGSPEVFLRTKAAGTLFVLSALVGLYRYRRCWAFPVTGSLACFQCCLLLYLTSGAPTRSEFLFHDEQSWIYPYSAFIDRPAEFNQNRASSTSGNVVAAQTL